MNNGMAPHGKPVVILNTDGKSKTEPRVTLCIHDPGISPLWSPEDIQDTQLSETYSVP